MTHKKELIAIGVGLLLIAGFTFWGIMDSKKVQEAEEAQPQTDIVYYYGDGCPHCKDVQTYLDENSVSDKAF